MAYRALVSLRSHSPAPGGVGAQAQEDQVTAAAAPVAVEGPSDLRGLRASWVLGSLLPK